MEAIVYPLICWAFILILGKAWEKIRKIKTKRILYLDDNEFDQKLLQINVKIEGCVFDCRSNLDDIWIDLTFDKPAAAIIDYHLLDGRKGTEVLEMFDKAGVPAVIFTGDDREILGLPEMRVIRKGPEHHSWDKIIEWGQSATA